MFTRRIKFTKPYKVDAVNGLTYSVGDVVEVPHFSARHFINRGVAEETEDQIKKPEQLVKRGRGRPKKEPEPVVQAKSRPQKVTDDGNTAA